MTQKERQIKAKDLIERFIEAEVLKDENLIEEAKKCVGICMDEIHETFTMPIIFSKPFTKEQRDDWEAHVKKLNDDWKFIRKFVDEY